MKAVLLDGLIGYNHEVPSDEVEEAIVKGSEALVKTMWDESAKRFKYTSCKGKIGYGGLDEPIVVHAAKLNQDKELLNVGYKALKTGIERLQGGFGKNLGIYVRRMPQYIGIMEQNQDLLEIEKDPVVTKQFNPAGLLVLLVLMGGIGYLSRFMNLG